MELKLIFTCLIFQAYILRVVNSCSCMRLHPQQDYCNSGFGTCLNIFSFFCIFAYSIIKRAASKCKLLNKVPKILIKKSELLVSLFV